MWGVASPLSFRDWIRKRGVTATARDLGVSRISIQNWLRGGLPARRRLFAIQQIAEKEGVKLTFEVLTPT